MINRLGRIERALALQREDPPAFLALAPIERGAPAFALYSRPAVGQPQVCPRIAAVLDEGEVFARRRQPVGEVEALQPDLVPRRLVVEGETLAVMADGAQAGPSKRSHVNGGSTSASAARVAASR